MAQQSVDLLVIENVSKSFDGRCVLKDVSAKLSTGKILGLIGKSAAGKSVLIHMLRGSEEYAPDSGRVIYNVNRCKKCGDLDLPFPGVKCSKCGGETETLAVDFWSLKTDDPLRQAVKGHIAIMLQRTFALFGDMTVVENVMEAIPADVQGDDRINKAIEMLKLVNMTHRTTHIARDLSGGEKQRVVMARQLAKEPLFFLADEPTGTLDPTTAEIVHKGLIDYVREKNICMVFASHWPEAIDRMADEAILLEGGNVVNQGEPKKVTAEFMKDYHFEKTEHSELGEPLIVLDNAAKHYFSVVRGVVKAVDGVSFDIKEREVFALVGYSGAGKTTTSRMIAGMTPATSGSVKIRIGDDWVDMSESGFAGKGRATPYIGFLHQEYTLYPFDTVLQNLSTCIGMKMPAELAKVKAIQVLQSVGFEKQNIEKLLYSYPDSLSVGECQRIAFAQVLIKEPRIIILDEPTGTMDPITKTIIAKSVIRARETLGETFIVVSHDMDFVLNCSDRAAFMKGGKVVSIGKPDEVLEEFAMEPPKVNDHEAEDGKASQLRGVQGVDGTRCRRRTRPEGHNLRVRKGRRGHSHGSRTQAHHQARVRDHVRAQGGGYRHQRARCERGIRRPRRRARRDHGFLLRTRPHRGGQDPAVQGRADPPGQRAQPHRVQGEAHPQERGHPRHHRRAVPRGLRGLRGHRMQDEVRHAAGGQDPDQRRDRGDRHGRRQRGHHPPGQAGRDRLQGAVHAAGG